MLQLGLWHAVTEMS